MTRPDLEFRYYSEDLARTPLLSVDGIAPTGPNLSHWPGNRTPQHLKHDLSTGIALNYAALPRSERADLREGVEWVTNTHFDTDGLLSLWVAMYPEKGLRHSQKLLDAAAAGDFDLAPNLDAVKFNEVVTAFADPNRSPIGLELWDLPDHDRHEKTYLALLDLMPGLLGDLDSYKELWEEPVARYTESADWLQARGDLRRIPDRDLTILQSDRELDYRAIQTAASTDRILWIRTTPEGNLFRFWHSTFSWFETVTVRPQPRRDLGQLASQLQEQFPGREGRWLAGSLNDPVLELHFGEEGGEKSPFYPSGTCLPHPGNPASLEKFLIPFLS